MPTNPSLHPSTVLNDLSKLTLLASDMSYGGTSIPNYNQGTTPLGEWFDTPTYPTHVPYSVPAGFVVDNAWEDSSTGGKAIALRNSTTGEVIIAFAGTDGPNPTDWVANTQHLGWNQYQQLSPLILNYLAGVSPTKVDFTGQSLGGALAQYMAYGYVSTQTQNNPNFDKSTVTLTTFNALGAKDGILLHLGSYDPTVLDGIGAVAHYYTSGDLVSRLGGGHIGGSPNVESTYLLNIPSYSINPATGQRYLQPNLIDAHRIETGFYPNLQPGSEFQVATLTPINYLAAPQSERLLNLIGGIVNDKATSPQGSLVNLMAGLLVVWTAAPPDEVNSIAQAVVSNLHDAGYIPEWKYSIWQHFDWSGPAALAVGVVGAMQVLGGYLADLVQATPDQISSLFATVRNWSGINATVPPAVSSDDRQLQAQLLFSSIGNAVLTPTLLSAAVSLSQVDPEALSQKMIAGAGNWLDGTLELIRSSAINVGQKVDTYTTTLATAIYKTAVGSPGAVSNVLTTTLASLITDTATAIGNAFSNLTAKAPSDLNLGQSLNYVAVDSYVKDYAAQLADQTTPGVLKAALADAMAIVESDGEVSVIQQGNTTDPFDTPGFDPATQPTPTVTFTQDSAQNLTLSLPFVAGAGGQEIALQLQGSEANDFLVLTSTGELTPDANGVVDITIPEGEEQFTFNLLATNEATANSSLSLSATLLDATGQPAGTSRLEATVHLTAGPTPANGFPTLLYPIVSPNGFPDGYSVPGFGGFGADTDFPGAFPLGIVNGRGNVNYTIVAPPAEWFLHTAAGNDSITGSNTPSFLAGGGGHDSLVGEDVNHPTRSFDNTLNETGLQLVGVGA